MRVLFLIILSLIIIGCCNGESDSQLANSSIESLIEQGEYTKAKRAIKLKIANDDLLTPKEVDSLLFEAAVLDRIVRDFNKTDSIVIGYIKEIYPQVTQQEIAAWEASGALECKIIDGKKRYFHSAHRNLFRISKEAQQRQSAIEGRQSDGLDDYLGVYIPALLSSNKATKNGFENFGEPKRFKITYTLTVKPNQVPAGEMIRVWMPYPRESSQHRGVELQSVSNPNYIISPDDYAHKSIYMEQPAVQDGATTFSYTLAYTSYDKWYDFEPEDVKQYDKNSDLYKKYTSQRHNHVIFTPDIKRLTDSIIKGESNPYLKAVKIFDFIADNYPWASAREYSTIKNIPQYVIDNNHGDCGQVSLLFITMARYAGIPAKWQSGWMLHPNEVNLHDWAEAYFEGVGWVPVDQSFGYVIPKGVTKEQAKQSDKTYHFFTKGLDCFRYIVNDDYSGEFFPAKIHHRSETVDFQRGEVEWRGENLYFGRWSYDMEVEYL